MGTYCRDIFDFITQQEAAYKLPIRMNDSWEWNMKEHIRTTENYTNSQLNNGKDDYTPVKNITLPILNLQHRVEDVDVKDVQIYADDPSKYHLSLLIKKYHDDVFVYESKLDEYIDKLGISRIDMGLGISRKLNDPTPTVIPLQSLAFCNQRDILAGPFCILHEFGPDQLLDMGKRGWGKRENGASHSIEELIMLWRDEEQPGEGLKIYEVHGSIPKRFSDSSYEGEDYETRMVVCAFYQPKGAFEKHGVILFNAEEDTQKKFKVIKRDEIYGRACGRGAAEELFESQVWTNYDMIRLQNMLDSAAVTILSTTDATLAGRHPNGLRGMKNLEVVERVPGSELSQVDTFPRNASLFEKSIASWETHAQQLGAANDAIMGDSPSSGTPFKLQELVTQEAHGLHEYRRAQFARHIEEIYRDWIIPEIKRKLTKDVQFLSELSTEEMDFIATRLAENAWNGGQREAVLSGEMTGGDEEREAFIQSYKDEFKKGGNKRFIKILANELRDTKLAVKVSVAGKSKNLAMMTDKLVNIFRFVFSNPQGFAQIMQLPGMSKSFNQILEFSGLSPVDFSGAEKLIQSQQAAAAQTEPLAQLSEGLQPQPA